MGHPARWSRTRRSSKPTWEPTMPLLEVSDLSVRYDKAQLLNDVSLNVEEHELVGLVGPNGAGKSTMLRAISGLVRWEAQSKRGATGDIVIEGSIRFNSEFIDGLSAPKVPERGGGLFSRPPPPFFLP